MQKAQENIDNKVYLKKKIFYFEKKRKHFTSFQREKISWNKRLHVHVPFVPTLIFQKVTCLATLCLFDLHCRKVELYPQK